MKRPTHKKVKKILLKDPKTLSAYDALAEEYQLINEILRASKHDAIIPKSILTSLAVILKRAKPPKPSSRKAR